MDVAYAQVVEVVIDFVVDERVEGVAEVIFVVVDGVVE